MAVAANNEVHLYGLQDDEWVLDEVLVKHDLAVTGIDWAPRTNRIVTCSADRNAYVWTPAANGQWTPELVLLRIDRAATCVRWSPSGAYRLAMSLEPDEVGGGLKLKGVR